MVRVFKNVGKRSRAKNYHLVTVFSMVSKIFEKLANNRLVIPLKKGDLLSHFQYGFRSARSIADLQTVAFDETARAFNRSGTNGAVTLDLSKAFDRVWYAVLLHKLKSQAISSKAVSLNSSFLSNRQLRVILDGKSLQEYPVMLDFMKAPLLVLHFFNYKLMTLLMMLSVIFLSMLMILHSTLCVIRHMICASTIVGFLT